MKAIRHQTDENRSTKIIYNPAEKQAIRIYYNGESISYATIGRVKLDFVWEPPAIEEEDISRAQIENLFKALAFNLIDNPTGYNIHKGAAIRAEDYDKEISVAPQIMNFLTESAASQLKEDTKEPFLLTRPGGRILYNTRISQEWFSVGQNIGQKRYIETAKEKTYFSKIMLYPAIPSKIIGLKDYEEIANSFITQSLDSFFT
jgi:hypothetical protein